MRQRGNFFERIVNDSDLLSQSLPGLPIVEIAGDSRVLVENHQGVKEYGTRMIRIQLRYGQLCVCGEGMELSQMTKVQLVITGRIDSISISRGGR